MYNSNLNRLGLKNPVRSTFAAVPLPRAHSFDKKMWKKLESIGHTNTPDFTHFLSHSFPLFIPFSSYKKLQLCIDTSDIFHFSSRILLLFIPFVCTIYPKSFTVNRKKSSVFTRFFKIILIAIKE